jgi:hypothetical protein
MNYGEGKAGMEEVDDRRLNTMKRFFLLVFGKESQRVRHLSFKSRTMTVALMMLRRPHQSIDQDPDMLILQEQLNGEQMIAGIH